MKVRVANAGRVVAVAGLLSVGLAGCAHLPVAPTAPGPPAAPATSPAPPVPAASIANRTPTPAPVRAPHVAAPKSAAAPAPGKPAARLAPAPAPAAPAAANRPAVPALDLGSLEQRLRDTKAIGVFTKLSLKNQVDDLLARFRDFYGKKSTTTLAQLRQKYDLLLLKVLSVLQDGDPALAATISASRESIWAILADPQKFSRL